MAIISFNNIAGVGMIKDVSPKTLPSSDKSGFGWTDVQNMRFKDDSVEKMPGYSTIIDTTGTVSPYFTQRINDGTHSFYLWAGLNKVYVQYSGTNYNITRQTTGVDVNYSATSDFRWNLTTLNGLPVLNNGIDIPQSWTPVNQSQKLANLNAWPTGYTASVIRSYKAYLIALNITTSTTTNPNLIKWSGAALPYQLPSTWDITDPTNDAGEYQIGDSDGYLVDCLALNDYNIIYKNTSTYAMSYVGGNNIFSIRKIFPNIGMLSTNCAAAFEGRHFVVSNDDVIIHDGSTYQSCIDGKNKKYLFNSINPTNYKTTFVVPNYARSEMWICFPSGNSVYPDSALIFNYKTGVWTKKSLPTTPWISEGFIDLVSSQTWSSASSTWQGATSKWDQTAFNQNRWSLTMVNPTANALQILDKSDLTDGGTPTYSYIERQKIVFSQDQDIKLIKGVWPKVQKLNGINNNIQIYIGTAIKMGDVLTWNGPYTFNTATDNKVDCLVSGREIGIRFSSSTDIQWSISGFDLDVANGGKF